MQLLVSAYHFTHNNNPRKNDEMPGGYKNINGEDGVKFSSTNQPTNNPGRPLKIYTKIKQNGYGIQDMKAIFGELPFGTIEDLKKISNDTTQPVIVLIVASALHKAYKGGDWSKIKEIMEHTIGKAPQSIEISGNQDKPLRTIIEIDGKDVEI